MLANDTSGLDFCSTDLRHIFGNIVRNVYGVPTIGKCHHVPKFAYVIFRIRSLMVYSDLVD